ncbi:hypothetical protein HO133_008414 [Letharia lupina]|uniref:SnoaL-like domain-containing protein n=1 Tax=Letharia lupina TaxID=560253 RepID=A0A8H6CP30_9LECA|nr:uncharacterized protein HO133_008414 [Letharia lupina]KAF6226973.1 hypothetical protein HO133_008414 [Letharia lupina]
MLCSPTSWPSFSLILFVSLSFTTTVLGVNKERSLSELSSATNLTAAIPFYSLPTTYPLSLTPQNPTIENQIRETLAHYPLAIDGKNFAALDLVFTQHVVANYSEPLGVLTGLPAVVSALESSLSPVGTQHAFSTQVIEILAGEVEARSLTYYTASHFGQGDYYGQVLYAYGQYQDDWIKICCPEVWRIKTRTLVYMATTVIGGRYIQVYWKTFGNYSTYFTTQDDVKSS